MTNLLLTVAGLMIAGLLSPGPSFVLISGRALASGRRPAIATAVGVAIGSLTHALFGIAGVGALLRASTALFTAAKLAGAAYLMWIGFKSLRGALRAKQARTNRPTPSASDAQTPPRLTPPSATVGRRRSMLDGYLTQMSNPKTTLFFLALFTTVVPADTGLLEGIAVLATVVTLALTGYVAIAMLFSRPALQRAYRRVSYVFDAMFGGLMLALGVRVALLDT